MTEPVADANRVETMVHVGLHAMSDAVVEFTSNELMSALLTLTWRCAQAVIDSSEPGYREQNRLMIQQGLERVLWGISPVPTEKSKVN